MSTIYGDGLAKGTRHILRNRFDNSEQVFKWTGGGWGSHGYATKAGFMSALGWSYARPLTHPVQSSSVPQPSNPEQQ